MPRGSALLLKVPVDNVLQGLIGVKAATRARIVQKLWIYIKKHALQDKKDGRFIYPDKKFAKFMGTPGQRINAFKMATFINLHLKKAL